MAYEISVIEFRVFRVFRGQNSFCELQTPVAYRNIDSPMSEILTEDPRFLID